MLEIGRNSNSNICNFQVFPKIAHYLHRLLPESVNITSEDFEQWALCLIFFQIIFVTFPIKLSEYC